MLTPLTPFEVDVICFIETLVSDGLTLKTRVTINPDKTGLSFDSFGITGHVMTTGLTVCYHRIICHFLGTHSMDKSVESIVFKEIQFHIHVTDTN